MTLVSYLFLFKYCKGKRLKKRSCQLMIQVFTLSIVNDDFVVSQETVWSG